MSMNQALGIAAVPQRIAAASVSSFAARSSCFARCEVFDALAPARAPWAELEALAPASPYQSYDFVETWLETKGRGRAITPMIVVARDETGRVNAVLPLGRSRRGPLEIAEFVGGGDANFKMGLFRPGLAASGEAIADLLRRAARVGGRRVDVFWLADQPYSWEGAPNPMAALPRRASPSFGSKTALEADYDAWFKKRYSKDSRKKLRKKAERLGEIGAVASVVARDEATARAILAAFLSQKAARMRALGMANSFECPHAAAFLEAATTRHLGEGNPTIELRALMSGERIVATLGGLAQAGRFCGMFISYDAEPEISRCSPGQLLVLETIRDLGARGFATFDLGVGEARYKDENCETDEPLFDTTIAATPIGFVFGAAMMLGRQVKGWIKRTPWAWSLVDGLRRRAYLLRNGRAPAGAR